MTPKQTRDALVAELEDVGKRWIAESPNSHHGDTLLQAAKRLAALPLGDGEPTGPVAENATTEMEDWTFDQWRNYAVSNGYHLTAAEVECLIDSAMLPPAGFVLVPKEPTPEMRESGKWEMSSSCEDVYRAMLAAAPAPGGKEGG